jgi:hypothetical protein
MFVPAIQASRDAPGRSIFAGFFNPVGGELLI